MAARLALLALLGAGSVMAHIEMIWPLPLHSKYSSQNVALGIANYNNLAPLDTADNLNSQGGSWPCKGFINNPSDGMSSVITYIPGEKYNFTTIGSATHSGGSCQLSLSYDLGKTFQVFQSYVGGCPLTPTLDFTFPEDAPSGVALFSWTWISYSGISNIYQDCAVVTVAGSGTAPLDSVKYPPPFVADAGVNDCWSWTTGNGTCGEVVYPDLGPNVQYGGSYLNKNPTVVAGFTGTNCVPPGQQAINTQAPLPSASVCPAAGAAPAVTASSVSTSSLSTLAPEPSTTSSSPSSSSEAPPPSSAPSTGAQGSSSAPPSETLPSSSTTSSLPPMVAVADQSSTCQRRRRKKRQLPSAGQHW